MEPKSMTNVESLTHKIIKNAIDTLADTDNELAELRIKYENLLAFVKMQACLYISDEELKNYSNPMKTIAIQCRELLKEIGEYENHHD